jgi:methanogenic corrinoid protein MtbC1
MESKSRKELLADLSDSILHGKTDHALELLESALSQGITLDDIVSKGILDAHLVFAEWYERDNIGSLKAWEFCFFTTNKVLKVLDSKIPPPEKPPFSVVVATARSEGHITMRDVIAIMLKAKGLRVYSWKRGITPSELDGPLTDSTLKYVVISCCEPGTKPILDSLIKEVRTKRSDVKIVAGGAFAPHIGADFVLNDPLKLYQLLVDHFNN